MALEVDITKKLDGFFMHMQFRAEREIFAILGASGCGKSMTLKCIAGIEKPDEGRIVLDGKVLFDSEKKINLPPQKRKVGYMFQDYALFPHMNVVQNIEAGMGKRPDRAVTVYGNLIRRTYKHTPMILGGIEASLRRLSHYDYWSDQVRRSVLLDSGADLISYGMGEHSILQIAEALQSGLPVEEITYIPGTVYKCKDLSRAFEPIVLPSYEEVSSNKHTYADSFAVQYRNTDPFTAKPLAESYGTRGYIIQNPPAHPLSQQEMDDVYDLPYTDTWHPMYNAKGGIPALKEIKFSLVYRDMWQSSGKYQPRADQLVRIAPLIIEMGCFSRVETNGGAFAVSYTHLRAHET